MLDGKPVLAVIPVRGGSKGIPRKNLYRLGKDTILERTIKLARACRHVDRTIVSTDDPEMFDVAKRHGAAAGALRPAALATDHALTVDVVLHVLEELGGFDGHVLLLQTTSPLRTLEDADRFFETFQEHMGSADAAASVTPHDSPHPDKIQKIEGGYVASYTGKESMVARQSLPKVYSLNGAFYLTRAEVLRGRRTFMPPRTVPFVMPKERSVNLDSMTDLRFLEYLMEKGLVALEEYPDKAAGNLGAAR